MQELTDDQLDGLFRKSSEEFDPPFDPAAWQALQNRLDAQQPAAPTQLLLNRKFIRWGLPVLVLLLTGSVWYAQRLKSVGHTTTQPQQIALSDRYTVDQEASPTSPARPEAVVVSESGHERPVSADPVPVRSVGANQTKQPTTNGPVTGSAPQPERFESSPVGERPTAGHSALVITDRGNRLITERTDKPARSMRSVTSTRHWLNRPRADTVISSGQTQTVKQHNSEQETPVFWESDHAINDTPAFSKRTITNENSDNLIAPVIDIISSESAERVSLPSLITLTMHPGRWQGAPTLIDREVTPIVVSGQPVVVKPVPKQRGLSVRFVVSPDLSTIGLRNYAKPGTNVGLLLEYRLASRWSIQAGVLQSTKVYRADTSDYELPPYVKKWPVKPEGVSGLCNMIDIPVNLRYDVTLRPGSAGQVMGRWFVSGGITTYITRQEDYTYEYTNPDDPRILPDRREKHVSKDEWYTLSQLNVSAGYERALGRRLAWQVEPFVKVPLRGVGYYKINLLSTGAFLSLRYKL